MELNKVWASKKQDNKRGRENMGVWFSLFKQYDFPILRFNFNFKPLLCFIIFVINLKSGIMNLLERIDQDIKKAMLAREKEKLEALRAVKNALLVQRTEKGGGSIIDEEAEIKILKRLVKQRKEAAELYVQQNRKDLAEVEEAQSKVISGYLPEQLSEDDIRQVVKGLIEQLGASDMKDMGKVMGAATKELAGKADNKLVSAIVKELLA